MKRLSLVLACVALAAPVLADKPQVFGPLAPTAMVTINGTPLTINIGDDTRMPFYNSNVPGTGQFYPPGGTLANSRSLRERQRNALRAIPRHLVVLLAAVGYVLARKTSLGA